MGSMPQTPPIASLPRALHTDTYLNPPNNPYYLILPPPPSPLGKKLKETPPWFDNWTLVWAPLMHWAHSDFDVGFLISQFLSKAFCYGSDSMFCGTVEMEIGSIDNTMPCQTTT